MSYQVPQHQRGGAVFGRFFGTYATLKVCVIAYKDAQREMDKGATLEAATRHGIVTGLAWIGFIMMTCWQIVFLAGVLIVPRTHFSKDHDGLGVQALTHKEMWTAFYYVGIPTVVVLFIVWIFLLRRLLARLAGRTYHRILPWWVMVIVASAGTQPFHRYIAHLAAAHFS